MECCKSSEGHGEDDGASGGGGEAHGTRKVRDRDGHKLSGADLGVDSDESRLVASLDSSKSGGGDGGGALDLSERVLDLVDLLGGISVAAGDLASPAVGGGASSKGGLSAPDCCGGRASKL